MHANNLRQLNMSFSFSVSLSFVEITWNCKTLLNHSSFVPYTCNSLESVQLYWTCECQSGKRSWQALSSSLEKNSWVPAGRSPGLQTEPGSKSPFCPHAWSTVLLQASRSLRTHQLGPALLAPAVAVFLGRCRPWPQIHCFHQRHFRHFAVLVCQDALSMDMPQLCRVAWQEAFSFERNSKCHRNRASHD